MATWTLLNGAAAPSHQVAGQAPYMYDLDVPDLISNGGLANTSNVATSLASTGFGSADILEVFECPAGFLWTQCGVRVRTVEGSTCTGDIGNTSATETHVLSAAAAGMQGTLNLNSATTQITLDTDTWGTDNYYGIMFITEGQISLTFNNACAAVIADIWALGNHCWPRR